MGGAGLLFAPLAEERAAALDQFLEELRVMPVREGKGWEKIQSLPRLFPELDT